MNFGGNHNIKTFAPKDGNIGAKKRALSFQSDYRFGVFFCNCHIMF